MARLHTRQLKKKTKAELEGQVNTFKNELSLARIKQLSGGAGSSIAKIRTLRHDIAKVKTVISHIKRDTLHKFYKGKKYIPTDLRKKGTRAMRRALTKRQVNLKTLKTQKKISHRPQLKYFVKQ